MLRYYCKVQAGIAGAVFLLCAALLAALRYHGSAHTAALLTYATLGTASLTLAVFLHRRWR